MAQLIVDSLRQAWFNLLGSIELYLPRFVALVIIAVVGWLIAMVFAFLTQRLLGWLRFNLLAKRIGAEDLLRSAGMRPANVIAGSLVFWLVWIGFLLSGIEALGFHGMDSLVAGFLTFIPHLLVAVFILIIGFVGANFVWRATLLAAVNAQLPSARLLSSAVRFLIVILTVAIALEQIAMATRVVLTAFAIAFGAIMLGLAIAFGVGGGQIARRILEQQFPDRERDKDEPGGMGHL